MSVIRCPLSVLRSANNPDNGQRTTDNGPSSLLVAAAMLFTASTLLAQHDISKVDPAPVGGAIAVPAPENNKRQMKRYEFGDLGGAKQALGSQLIDGRLPKPLLDYITRDGLVEQRISLFEGGLVVVNMSGAANIRKKVLIPLEAMKSYLTNATPAAVRRIDPADLTRPDGARSAVLRVYEADGTFVEKHFNPIGILPRALYEKILPLQDLLRVVSEDREVTSSVAGYEPKEGDELVADDQRIYRVTRVVEQGGIVELKCLTDPISIFVAKKDLHQYFIGARPKH